MHCFVCASLEFTFEQRGHDEARLKTNSGVLFSIQHHFFAEKKTTLVAQQRLSVPNQPPTRTHTKQQRL